MHADWSKDPGKRWAAFAANTASRCVVYGPRLAPTSCELLDMAFREADQRSVLLGFDFPIGLPSTYGLRTQLPNFPSALRAFGVGEWETFYQVAETPEQVCIHRPFYPRTPTRGVSRSALVAGLGVNRFDDLLRVCERPTIGQRAACSVFWTLGGNQVGRAAIAGWQEVITPAMQRGAKLWPFDGPLARLAGRPGVTIAETYPALAYPIVGAKFHSGESKQRHSDRIAKANAILDWARQRNLALSSDTQLAIADGFGPDPTGEDAFDALLGLLKIIEVVSGRRAEAPDDVCRATLSWEGWMLGR